MTTSSTLDFFNVSHWGIGERHDGKLEDCKNADCVWDMANTCHCAGKLDVLMTIDDSRVIQLHHEVCGKDLNSDWFETMNSDGEIPVQVRWEESTDWETGYTDGWLVVSSRT